MISIPQNLQIEAKSLIKDVFFSKCNDLINNYLSDLFYNFCSSKYITGILNLINDFKAIVIDTISYVIKVIDKLFLDSEYRKKKFYINKQAISRTIVDVFGTLCFERNYYTDKNKENGFFLIDEIFGFEKYKTYGQVIRGLLINEATNTNVNRACNNSLVYNFSILDNLNHGSDSLPNIPRQTIYNWINNWVLPKIEYNTIETPETIYVMADEKWIHEQIRKAKLDIDEKDKKHYIMSKCFVLFTGVKRKNKRTKLLNKHIFITSSKTPWKDLMDEICKIYDFEKIKTINLLSDAGNWILAGKDELKLYSYNSIIVNTCEFHVVQKIHRITHDDELRKSFIDVIYNEKDKNKFVDIMDKLINDKPKRKDKLTEYKNYITKHWKGILNMKTCDVGSSMEAHISHCVAEHFGSRPKGYSKDRIEKYLKQQEYRLNGINILDLFFKSCYQDEDFVYNEKEVNFSIFDKNTSLLPVCSSTNPISLLMHNIAYNY